MHFLKLGSTARVRLTDFLSPFLRTWHVAVAQSNVSSPRWPLLHTPGGLSPGPYPAFVDLRFINGVRFKHWFPSAIIRHARRELSHLWCTPEGKPPLRTQGRVLRCVLALRRGIQTSMASSLGVYCTLRRAWERAVPRGWAMHNVMPAGSCWPQEKNGPRKGRVARTRYPDLEKSLHGFKAVSYRSAHRHSLHSVWPGPVRAEGRSMRPRADRKAGHPAPRGNQLTWSDSCPLAAQRNFLVSSFLFPARPRTPGQLTQRLNRVRQTC